MANAAALNRVRITHDDLLAMLLTQKGATPAVVMMVTVPDLIKPKQNPYNERLAKYSAVHVMLNFDYTNSVNNQREREGLDRDFVPEPRKYGRHIPGTPIIEHEGKFLVWMKCLRSLDTRYVLDGREVVNPEVLEDIRTHVRKRVGEGANQGVEKPAVVRNVYLDNITGIHINKGQYDVVRPVMLAPPYGWFEVVVLANYADVFHADARLAAPR